ncbi:MAG: hypothetical protein JJU29_00180 [Verrucomicrobia bacterium]|nr:hypothetical protein [Verrucomicrobiota bacterium]MCH8511024.1 hypothetical protein [Kiritimatiellia bacterium]
MDEEDLQPVDLNPPPPPKRDPVNGWGAKSAWAVALLVLMMGLGAILWISRREPAPAPTTPSPTPTPLPIATPTPVPDDPAALWDQAWTHYIQGDQTRAVSSLLQLLRLKPDHVEAEALLPRARVANQTLAALEAARANRDDPAIAMAGINRAHQLDAKFPGVAELRAELQRELETMEVSELKEKARAAMENGQWQTARDFIDRALVFRPDDTELLDLRSRVQARITEGRVDRLVAEALAFEAAEDWNSAHARWLEAQSLYPDASEIEAGEKRTLNMRVLTEKLRRAEQSLTGATAKALAEELRGMSLETFPSGLSTRAKNFLERWDLQHTPIPIRIRSDGETEVTILRNQPFPFPPFVEKNHELLPGNYVAVGTRLGYRDVRVPFTVPPGGEEVVIEVKTTQGIYD